MKKAEQEREEIMKEKLKKLKEKISEVSCDVTYCEIMVKGKSEELDELEEQVAKALDSIQDLSNELYECFEELKIVKSEITVIKDLCDELIEEEEK